MNNGNSSFGIAKLYYLTKNSSLISPVIIVSSLLLVMIILRPNYLSSQNIYALTRVLTITALIAFSQMISISSGGLNLSIGAIGALCAILAGGAMDAMNFPAGWAFLIGILAGVICGLINGLLIHRAGGSNVAFFLTTLATMSVFTGINLTITSGIPFYNIKKEFLLIGETELFGLPSSFFIMIAVAGSLFFIFNKTTIGRQILAFGANSRSSLLYGVSMFKVILISNTIAGLLAALAGLLAVIRIEAAQPNMGADWLLLSFAATLIGGTKLTGGSVNIIGTIIGATALTIIANSLVHLRIDIYWNQLIYGMVILSAVTIDRLRYYLK